MRTKIFITIIIKRQFLITNGKVKLYTHDSSELLQLLQLHAVQGIGDLYRVFKIDPMPFA
jgi:hypothetical protein